MSDRIEGPWKVFLLLVAKEKEGGFYVFFFFPFLFAKTHRAGTALRLVRGILDCAIGFRWKCRMNETNVRIGDVSRRFFFFFFFFILFFFSFSFFFFFFPQRSTKGVCWVRYGLRPYSITLYFAFQYRASVSSSCTVSYGRPALLLSKYLGCG